MTPLPFKEALGEALNAASDPIRKHFSQEPGYQKYCGIMERVWRATGWKGLLVWPFLLAGRLSDTLLSATGSQVPFELENVVTPHSNGHTTMTWTRTFHFNSGPQRFHAVMVYDPNRKKLIDWIGKNGRLEVELRPAVVDGALRICSGRQWFWISKLRIPIPTYLTGAATVKEFSRTNGTYGISVVVNNPILGDIFGYEGTFEKSDTGL